LADFNTVYADFRDLANLISTKIHFLRQAYALSNYERIKRL